MPSATRFSVRIQDMDDFADALTWENVATFEQGAIFDQVVAFHQDVTFDTNVYVDSFFGVGTLTPDAPIHIVNSSGAEIRVGSDLGDDAFIELNSAVPWILRNEYVTDSFQIERSGTTFFTIDNAGNTGFGASDPSHTLDAEGAGAQIDINATSGNPVLEFEEAGTWKYRIGYSVSSNRFFVSSTDTDGGGTDDTIFRIPDGQTDIDANTKWNNDVFDYVCKDCGWHHMKKHDACPECGGQVEWQDDAALVHNMLHAPDRGHFLRTMEKQGLVDMTDAIQTDTGYKNVFMPLQTMQQFTLSAVAQLWKRIEQLEAQLA